MDRDLIHINLENYDHGFWDGLTMCKRVEPMPLTFRPMIPMTIDV